MNSNFEVIKDLRTANQMVTSLLNAPIIGLDCEGVHLGPTGKVTLIQVARPNAKVLLFDVLTCPEIMGVNGKLPFLLENPTTIKVVHDCKADRANLKNEFGVNLGPVYDTQVAYKFVDPSGVHPIGLNNLYQLYKLSPNPWKDGFSRQYARNDSLWSMRPLTSDMIQYAIADVKDLVELHWRMDKHIKPSDRGNFVRMCREVGT